MKVMLIGLALILCRGESDSIPVRIEKAKALAAAGQYEAAVSEFESVLREDPLNGTALFNLGNIYGNNLGNQELRDSYWKRYKASSHVSLAEVAVEEGNLEEAAEYYRRALEVVPDSAILHEQLGALYKKMGKEAEALEEYRAAADADPGDLQLQLALWEYFSKRGEREDAAKYLDRALRIRPGDEKLRRVAEAFYTKIGDDDRAREQVEALSRVGRASSAEHCRLGALYVKRGDLEKAERELRRGYEPGTREECLKAARELGNAWSERGEQEKASRVYLSMLEKGDPDPRSFNLLLITYQKMGKLDAAVEIGEKAVAAFPDDAALRNNLATLYALRKEYEPAIAEYRRAVKLDPSLAGVYLDMGIIYKDYLGDRDRAADYFRKYITLDPEGRKQPEVIKLLGFEDEE